MRRGNNLQGVADNFLAHFVSRNNDTAGYWTMGVIMLHLTSVGRRNLVIDLWDSTTFPNTHDLHPAFVRSAEKLEKLLWAEGFSRDRMTKQTLRLEFNFDPRDEARVAQWEREYQMRESARVGEPFEFHLLLSADDGASATAIARGRAFPHGAASELRRGGAHNPYLG